MRNIRVEGLAEDGAAIPEPSTLEALMSDAANRDGVAILVAPKWAATKSVRVNVTLPEDVLQATGAHAARHGFTRSGFLAQAARRAREDAA